MVDVSQDPRVEAAAEKMFVQRTPGYRWDDAQESVRRNYRVFAAQVLAAADAVGGVPEPSRDDEEISDHDLAAAYASGHADVERDALAELSRRLGDDT